MFERLACCGLNLNISFSGEGFHLRSAKGVPIVRPLELISDMYPCYEHGLITSRWFRRVGFLSRNQNPEG